MKQNTKLILDIVIGAVIPILILNNLSKPLGAPVAYVIAALIPVAWVLIDLFAITRRFNMITGMTGLNALLAGGLAFWFVDGVRYAIKDTTGLIITTLLFGISILIGRPLLRPFVVQVLNPDTAERSHALDDLIGTPAVRRSLQLGTLIIVIQSILAGVINFLLNLNIVQARFGSDSFNQQVAQVNAITRIGFPILSIAAFFLAIWLVYRALYQQLPSEEGKSKLESEFWTLVELKNQGIIASEDLTT